jgi:hypothetical protein
VVGPEVRGRLPFEVLGFAMSLEDGNELGRQGYGLAAPFFDLPEDQTAALAVGAGCRVPGAARRADPGIVGGDACVPPAGPGRGGAARPQKIKGISIFVDCWYSG